MYVRKSFNFVQTASNSSRLWWEWGSYCLSGRSPTGRPCFPSSEQSCVRLVSYLLSPTASSPTSSSSAKVHGQWWTALFLLVTHLFGPESARAIYIWAWGGTTVLPCVARSSHCARASRLRHTQTYAGCYIVICGKVSFPFVLSLTPSLSLKGHESLKPLAIFVFFGIRTFSPDTWIKHCSEAEGVCRRGCCMLYVGLLVWVKAAESPMWGPIPTSA